MSCGRCSVVVKSEKSLKTPFFAGQLSSALDNAPAESAARCAAHSVVGRAGGFRVLETAVHARAAAQEDDQDAQARASVHADSDEGAD